MSILGKEKIQKVKIAVLIISLIIATFFFSVCIKRIINHEESYYSVIGKSNDYKNISGKHIDTSVDAMGNDITKVVLYTNDAEVYGTIRYCLKDNKENILYDNSLKFDSIFEGEGADNPLELTFQKCPLKKGETYILTIDFGSFNNPINILYSDESVYYQEYYTFQHRYLFLGIVGLVYLCFILMILLVYRNGFDIKNFVLESMIIGVIALFIMPPANRDDEFRHFLRAYELSTGELKAELINIPGDSYGNAAFEEGGMGYYLNAPKKINDMRLVDCNTNHNDFSYFAEVNSTLNFDALEKVYKEKDVDNYAWLSLCAVADRNPIFYLPMSFMIFIGRMLNVNGVFYFYLARLGQLVICTILGVLALKLAPKLKNAIYLATFAPPIVLLRSSCNTDGLMISLIILYISLLFYIREKEIDLLNSKKGTICFASLLLCAGIITLMKLPYILLCIGSLFILKIDNVNAIKNNIKKYKFAILCLVCLAVFGGIIVQIKTGLFTTKIYSILPKEHVAYMCDHPVYVIKLFLLKFKEQIKELYNCMNTNTWLPYSIVMILSMIFSTNIFSRKKKMIFFITFVAIVFSIILVGYTLTPPDYGRIWGITYRYLLPSLMIIMLCMPIGNEETENVVKQIAPLLVCMIIFSSIPIWFSSWWLCL